MNGKTKVIAKDYEFPLADYISEEKFERIKKFSEGKETPFLIVDLDVVKEKYNDLRNNLPFAKIYYALKANPMKEVAALLRDLGSNFDMASIYELDELLSLGISSDRISYGSTLKKARHIKYAFDKGVRLFASDSESDLNNISVNAPGSKVFCRLLTDNTSADWPLSKKFGAHPDMVFYLLLKAKKLGLVPYGVSFHVGSQQRDIGQWDNAISKCKYLFDSLKEEGIELKMINLGGGFPSRYIHPTELIEEYAKEIERFLREDFPNSFPEIIIEPGRSLVGDSGIIISEVVLASSKTKSKKVEWVYLDIGKFSGLIETLDESIKYPIYTEKKGTSQEVILAGPTCDSMDILYEKDKYSFPNTIHAGDRVYIFTTGAYTQSYSSICFNGFPPLKSYVLE